MRDGVDSGEEAYNADLFVLGDGNLLLITGLKGDVEEDDSGDFEDLLGDRSGGSEGGKRSA